MRIYWRLFAIPALAMLLIWLHLDILQIELLRQVTKGLAVLAHLQLVDHLENLVFLLLAAAF